MGLMADDATGVESRVIWRECQALPRWTGPRTPDAGGGPPAGTRHVYTSETADNSFSSSLLNVLWDDEEDEEVRHIRLDYHGSRPRYARVEVQGVPTQGIIDSGADITIISGELFKRVAAVTRLKKRDLKKPDRVPRIYDHRPFTLHGKMELDLTFDDTTLKTLVYIKVDAREPGDYSVPPRRPCSYSAENPAIADGEELEETSSHDDRATPEVSREHQEQSECNTHRALAESSREKDSPTGCGGTSEPARHGADKVNHSAVEKPGKNHNKEDTGGCGKERNTAGGCHESVSGDCKSGTQREARECSTHDVGRQPGNIMIEQESSDKPHVIVNDPSVERATHAQNDHRGERAESTPEREVSQAVHSESKKITTIRSSESIRPSD